MPADLIQTIQTYIEGAYVYIPRTERTAWGSGTGLRDELDRRNKQIIASFRSGSGIPVLAEQYCLSEERIRAIVFGYGYFSTDEKEDERLLATEGLMIIDLDVHPRTGRMVVLQLLPDGSKNAVVYDLRTWAAIGVIDSYFDPQGPRFSPGGDQIAFFGDGEICVYTIQSGSTASFANDPILHGSFCEWSPDGKSLAYNAFPVSPTNPKSPPNMYLTDFASNRRHVLSENEAVERFPEWSPCGRYIAFHRQYPDHPNPPKQIVIADLAAGSECTVPRIESSSQETGRFCWSDDSSLILIKEVQDDGTVELKAVSLERMEPVWSIVSPDIIGGAWRPGTNQVVCMLKSEIAVYDVPSISGTATCKLSLAEIAPAMRTLRGPAWHVEKDRLFFVANRGKQVHKWNIGEEGSISILRSQDTPTIDYRREKYKIVSRDGRAVPVLRLIPKEPRNVAVELVFGGPGAPIDEEYPVVRYLLQEGYEVVCPVYRGQMGFGKEHLDANIGEMGRADVWDVVECGLDWKRRTGHTRPLALLGFSYGGLLTLLALAEHTALWATGITLWGVTHLDYLGFQKARAYPSDPALLESERKHRSPLERCSQICTPMLMLHGGRDTTSTNEDVQAIEASLQARGVPCELTIFPDDTHGLRRHRQDMFALLFEHLLKFE